MGTSKTHIYFVPGLGASSKIYDYIQLPADTFELHFLEWLIPIHSKELIEEYAKRMANLVTEENAVLIGVSFGGIMVQEMSHYLKLKKVIIISSVKSHTEFPKRLVFIRKTGIYKLFTSRVIQFIEAFFKNVFPNNFKKRILMYQLYLSVRNPIYLKWALHTVLHWKQKEPTSTKILHIQGDNDHIFPIKNIDNCIKIDNGTHVMILFKAKKISKIILNHLINC